MNLTKSKPVIVFPKNSAKVMKSSHYGQILNCLEEVEFASIIEDRDNSLVVELLLDGQTLEFEIVEEGKPFTVLPRVSIKTDEPYYGLRLLERTIEAFKSVGINLSMSESTKAALGIWDSFRETTPKVGGNLRPILFPMNTLAICTKLGIVEQREQDIFFL